MQRTVRSKNDPWYLSPSTRWFTEHRLSLCVGFIKIASQSLKTTRKFIQMVPSSSVITHIAIGIHKRIDLAGQGTCSLKRTLNLVPRRSSRYRINQLACRIVKLRGWMTGDAKRKLFVQSLGYIFRFSTNRPGIANST
jgi:hypothetical protein